MDALTAQETATQAVLGALAGIVYGTVWFARQRQKNRRDGEPPESFNWHKLGATIIVGAFVGGSAGASGDILGQAGFEERLLTYAGAITFLEAALKSGRDRFVR